jgi:hypothetical protein
MGFLGKDMTMSKPTPDDDLNPRAVIGGNMPPLEEQLATAAQALIDRIEPIATRANALPRVIASEKDIETIAPVVIDAKNLSRELEKTREAQKKPFLEGGKAVDGFFKPMTTRLDRIVSAFEGLTSQFQRDRAAAERLRLQEEARIAQQKADKLREDAEKAKRPQTAEKRADLADQAEADAERAAAAAAQSTQTIAKIDTGGAKVSGRAVWAFEIEDLNKVDLNAIRPFIDREAIEKALRAYAKIQRSAAKVDGVKFFEDVKSSFR